MWSPWYYSCLLLPYARSETKRCIVALYVGAFSHRRATCQGRETRSLVIRVSYRLHRALLPGIFNNKGLSVRLQFNDWLTPPYTSHDRRAKNYRRITL